MAAALLALAAPAAAQEGPCPGGLCGAEALSPWFEELARLEEGAPIRVHVLQIGDSHTAGEVIPGTVRSRLQGRFGRGGRGYVAPGVPHDGYAPRQLSATASGWSWAPKPARVGGYLSAEPTGLFGGPARVFDGDALTLALDPEAATARVGLCGRDGLWVIEADGVEAARLELFGPQCRTTPVDPAARTLTLRPGPGGGALDGVWLEGPRPGVILSNVGQVGATLADLQARDEATVRAELAPFPPDLIILAFGTNEGFDDGLDAYVYEATLRDQIRRMRLFAPDAAIVVLGAPDALRRGEVGSCPGVPERGPPANLARVRHLQRLVAAETGVAFWDWQGRMGGECSAERLVTAREPMMRGDRVHFTSAGGEWIGGLLADDLIGAYDAWKATRAGAR
ncbi:MAG TPA: GDSL-type esterase/lipase family protein [Brevundimonas sp.]|uniref:GDSL-type esterase/lipase family protein n=1 Tax=Brevundimonas sp. TaxID=1871086 RepID=UPI002DE31F78|nr:GDSL-type esterase/lipase family protein [Brevundimonas sp.]